MTYDNILKALGRSGEGLTPQQQSDNYKAFNELMKQGVYLPDVLSEVDSLKARVEALERPQEDMEVFAVMESSVKDDSDIRTAKAKLADAKTRVISELCMRDEGYRKCYEDYRAMVHSKYVAVKEKGARE